MLRPFLGPSLTLIQWVQIILRIISNWRKSCRENQNAFCSITSFFTKNSAVCEIWKNIVKIKRPQITIQHGMCLACWITKATNTHSEYVTLIVFPLQQRLHNASQCYIHTYTACLVTYLWRRYTVALLYTAGVSCRGRFYFCRLVDTHTYIKRGKAMCLCRNHEH